MANGFDSLHITDAVPNKSKFDLSRPHLTTMDFGEITPVFCEEGLPGDKFTVDMTAFARLAPMVFPTYGKCCLKSAAYYVDYYQLADDFEAFISGQTTYRGTTPQLRVISADGILDLLTSNPSSEFFNDLSTEIANPSSESEYDFTFDEDGIILYYKFTRKGRWVFKCLRSLGYDIPTQRGDSSVFSAMPLLAFFKAYNDYMALNSIQNMNITSQMLQAIKNKVSASVTVYPYEGGAGSEGYTVSYNGSNVISGDVIRAMFDDIRLCFDNDYVTSLWSTANQAYPGLSQNITTPTLNGVQMNQSVVKDWNNTSVSGISGSISQRSLDVLRMFDNWVRRNNYVGSKDVNQIYARFGIHPENFKAKYSHMIGKSEDCIQVGDVTSTSDTYQDASNGAVIGSYAGKGIASGDSKFVYSPDEFGCLIILSWISVRPMYTRGFQRHTLRQSPTDFYTPEFDGVGGNAVSYREITVPKTVDDESMGYYNDGVGFNERYCEYRDSSKKGIVSGDFLLDTGMDAWHFGRDLDSLYTSHNLGAQTYALNTYGVPGSVSEYDRIFNNAGSVAGRDHFFISFYFNVQAIRPIKNMNAVADLGSGDINISKVGNEVN
ncbi:major capsid protein [Capybara microvirus Cap3_SP_367]|nr:major capsid protein [Capybara microvirus Cap3_SP_367]